MTLRDSVGDGGRINTALAMVAVAVDPYKVAVYSEGVGDFSISNNPQVATPVTLREGITLLSNSFSLGQNDYVVLTVEASNALTSISLADLQPRDYVGALLIERLPSPDAPITYEYDFASPNFNQTHPADGLLGWAMLQEDAIGDSILGERAAGSDEVTYYPGASGWSQPLSQGHYGFFFRQSDEHTLNTSATLSFDVSPPSAHPSCDSGGGNQHAVVFICLATVGWALLLLVLALAVRRSRIKGTAADKWAATTEMQT